MNFYLDLSIITHILMMLFALTFVNAVNESRLKISGICKFIVFVTPTILTLYCPTWLAILLMILVPMIMFILFFKSRFIVPFIAYLFSYYYEAFIMTLLSPNVRFIKLVLAVLEVDGLISLISVPISFLVLKLVSILVDQLYHLGNYKIKFILRFNEEKALVKGYYDTGNTLKYKGLPVIFFKRSYFPFSLPEYFEEIQYETISGRSVTKLYKASIMLDDKKESNVYVALIDDSRNFYGCECLLNAYLGV